MSLLALICLAIYTLLCIKGRGKAEDISQTAHYLAYSFYILITIQYPIPRSIQSYRTSIQYLKRDLLRPSNLRKNSSLSKNSNTVHFYQTRHQTLPNQWPPSSSWESVSEYKNCTKGTKRRRPKKPLWYVFQTLSPPPSLIFLPLAINPLYIY